MKEVTVRIEGVAMDQWVVLLNTGTDIHVYGPMEAVEAQAFALFMTKEADPATAFKLKSPLREVLGWRESEQARNKVTVAPQQE